MARVRQARSSRVDRLHRTLDGWVEIAGGVPEGVQVVDSAAAGLVVGRKAMVAVAEQRR